MLDLSTMQLLKRRAPAALNTVGPDEERTSSQYRFIPTLNVIDSLVNDHGFKVVGAHQSTRKRQLYGLHHVEFESERFNRQSLSRLGDTQLRVWLRSAHNGQCAYQLGFGLFRLVCSNGLTIQDKEHGFQVRIKHVGSAPVMVESALGELTQRLENFYRTIERVQSASVSTTAQMYAILRAGLEARNTKYPLTYELANALDQARRMDDYGSNLWRVINRVQENLIHGVTFADSSSKTGVSTLKATNSYNSRARISTALFNEAVKIAA